MLAKRHRRVDLTETNMLRTLQVVMVFACPVIVFANHTTPSDSRHGNVSHIDVDDVSSSAPRPGDDGVLVQRPPTVICPTNGWPTCFIERRRTLGCGRASVRRPVKTRLKCTLDIWKTTRTGQWKVSSLNLYINLIT